MAESSMDERQKRRALNEAAFRQINERLTSVNEAFSSFTGRFSVVCECDDTACVEELSLSPQEYERVRSDSVLFVVCPGHESPSVEEVIEEGPGYNIVRKRSGEPAEIAQATDPRR